MRNIALIIGLLALLTSACDKGASEKPDDMQAESEVASTESTETEQAAPDEADASDEAEEMAAGIDNVEVIPLQHGSFMFTWQGVVVAVDPTTAALEAHDGDAPKADIILLTDIHPDHLDPAAVKTVRKDGATVIAPQAVVDRAGDALPDVLMMANGESQSLMDDAIEIEATPMYNTERMRPDTGKPYHVKGRGNGYLLTMGSNRVYISGDTECTAEMKALEDIDVAFVTMNLPYTMPVEEAATCIQAFEPAVVYPFHFRGKDGVQDVSKLEGLLGDASTEIRILDWYPGSD
ncbi:MAG: MBL fold metallo-hydrolase [Myxococcota bacterium]